MKAMKSTTERKTDGNVIRLAALGPFARRGKPVPASRKFKDKRRKPRVTQKREACS